MEGGGGCLVFLCFSDWGGGGRGCFCWARRLKQGGTAAVFLDVYTLFETPLNDYFVVLFFSIIVVVVLLAGSGEQLRRESAPRRGLG